MKSNGRCSMPPAVAPPYRNALAERFATAISDSKAACPPIVDYSPTDQAKAAYEIDTLSEASFVVRMLSDHAVLRDQARICG